MRGTQWWEMLLAAATDRRRFIAGLSAALATAQLGCDDGGGDVADAAPDGGLDAGVDSGLDAAPDQGVDAEPDAAPPPDLNLFEALRGMRDALRASPDHLPRRAAEVVASGDPAAIFAFVRDHIAVLPTSPDGMPDAVTRVEGGARNALRSGGGTPRDVAELLASLFQEAGLAARVMTGRPDRDGPDLHSWLLRARVREFAPPATDAERAAWAKALALDPDDAPPPLDADMGEALAGDLAALLPDTLRVRPFDWRPPSVMPVVEVDTPMGALVGCPWLPDVALGDPCVTDVAPLTAAQAAAPAPVAVQVDGIYSDALDTTVALVAGEWTLDQLLGRQICLQFTPSLPLAGLLQTPLSQVPLFIPTLAVQAVAEAAPLEDLVRGAPAFAHDGARVTVSADGVQVNGRPISGGLPSGRVEAVASVDDLAVDAGGFDTVRVRFSPRDAQGDVVEGLTSADLTLTEDGAPQGFLLTANTDRPRVDLYVDQSLSMPEVWREEGAADAFAGELQAGLMAAYPGATATLATRLDSDVWRNIAAAGSDGAQVVVYVTDGDIADERTPALAQAIGAGPPVVIIHVTENNREALEAIAALAGGVVVPVADRPGAVAAIADYLGDARIPAYVIQYQAPRAGAPTREVIVGVREGPTGSGTYDVPPDALPRRLVALRLQLTIDGETVVRPLAGMHPRADTPPADAVDQVDSLLWSQILIGFEGQRPPESVVFDELITARLSGERLLRALAGDDSAETLAAAEAGQQWLPADLLQVVPPRPSSDSALAFSSGPQVTVLVQGPRFETDRFGQRLDVLPFGRFAVAQDGEPAGRLAAALAVSARVAVAEAGLHETATLGLLDGPLELATRVDHFRDRLDPAAEVAWERLLRAYNARGPMLVPASGTPLALWSVDQETGSLLGVLPDGSGGAQTFVGIIDSVSQVAAFAEHLRTLRPGFAGLGGVDGAFGAIGRALPVAAYTGELLARLFGVATIVVASLDAYRVPELLRADLLATACDALQRISPGGHWIGVSNTLGALIVGDPEAQCVGARLGLDR